MEGNQSINGLILVVASRSIFGANTMLIAVQKKLIDRRFASVGLRLLTRF